MSVELFKYAEPESLVYKILVKIWEIVNHQTHSYSLYFVQYPIKGYYTLYEKQRKLFRLSYIYIYSTSGGTCETILGVLETHSFSSIATGAVT